MKLKCIGGLADGKMVDVPDDFKDYDYVRVPLTIEFTLSNFEEELVAFLKNETPKSVSMRYAIYKIHSLHNINNNHKSTIKFLVPEKWDYWESLLYLFTAHTSQVIK